MLNHLLYARAARGFEEPDYEAHANLSCQMEGWSDWIASSYRSAYSTMTGWFVQ